MQYLAQTFLRPFILTTHRPLHAALYHIAHHRGAVIVEEVVAILAVLGLAVLYQIGQNGRSLLLVQCQHLFGNTRTAPGIGSEEEAELHRLEHVIALAKHEAPYEMGLGEGEHTIVERHIERPPAVPAADGSMPIQRIHLLSG